MKPCNKLLPGLTPGIYLPIFQQHTYMKPHLPVSLFRALVAAAIAFPAFVSGALSDVPSDYHQIIVTTTDNVISGHDKTAFLIKPANETVTNPQISWPNATLLQIPMNSDVLFTSFNDANRCGISMSNGSRVLWVGDATFVGLHDINLESISTGVQDEETCATYGGVITSGSLTYTNAPMLTFFDFSYELPDAVVTFKNNRNVNISRNTLSASANHSQATVHAFAFGGAIMSPNIDISGNKDVTIETNTVNAESRSKVADRAGGRGGALYGSNITISNNEDVSFQHNRLNIKSSGTANADGAAIYSNDSVTIAGNDSVIFRDNAIYRKSASHETFYLESIHSVGELSLSAGESAKISFYDPIKAGSVSINDIYTDENGDTQVAVGDVIFSGEHAETDLKGFIKSILGSGNETPATDDMRKSLTSEVRGTTSVHGGRMMICDGAIFSTGRFEAFDKSTLYINNATLQATDDISFQSGSNLYLKGAGNLIQADSITFSENNLITLNISAANNEVPLAEIKSDLFFSAGTTINITSDNQLEDNAYTLFTLSEQYDYSGWNATNVTVTSDSKIGFTATFANLHWQAQDDGTRKLVYYTTMTPLLDATWHNYDPEDRIWSFTSINWEQEGQPYAYSNGATATFTAEYAGLVILKGDLRPSEVTVNNTPTEEFPDGDYEWVAHSDGGKLVGDMKLYKYGTGALKISLANEYTGGTILEDGTLEAGHEQAFGTGDITVKGGTLNMGDFAVTNKVMLNAGTFAGTAYAGELVITGEVNIGENTTAKSVEITSASTNGGSFTNTTITSQAATINTVLADNTNLIVNGVTTLRGDHTTKGTFIVKNGVLALDGTTSASLIDLQGGSLSTDTPMVLISDQELKFSGGNLEGSLETTDNSKLSATASATISGDLTLNGGTFTPGGPDITLEVAGTMNILGTTTINVENYVDGGINGKGREYLLVNAGSISGSVDMLSPVTNTRNINTLKISLDTSLILTVVENPAELYWKPGEVGTWGVLDQQEWDTTAEDTRFYDRDKVVFDAGGNVEIIGDVKPAELTVTGSENVILGGTGSIAGKTSLVKDGSSTLTMNAKNTYEGGTIIKDGSVNAGGAESFGSGDITLENGLLNLGDFAVKNNVLATGGKFNGTAYAGTLTVDGDIKVGDNTTAAAIALKGGSISDGSLKDADVTASGTAAIYSAIKGNTSITVEQGEVSLYGINSSTGDVVVNSGELNITRSESFGTGDVYLNGGRMNIADSTTLTIAGKQNLTFCGGHVKGNLRTSNGSGIAVDRNATIDGNLRLNGGTIYFNGKEEVAAAKAAASRSMIIKSNGCTLTVTGSLTLTTDTMLQLEAGQYTDGDILMEAGSLTGDFGKLVLNYDDGNPDTEYALVLKETDGKVQVMLDLDKVYEHTDGKWTISNGDLRDLLVQSNWGMFASSHAFSDAMQGQRSASGVVGSKGVMVWASALYNHMSVNDDGTKNGGDTDTMGAAVGIETMIGSRSCIGLAVGVTSSDISVGNIADEMEQDGTYIGLYGATVLSSNEISGLTLSWSAAYGAVDSSPSGAASSIEWQQDSFQLNGRLDWSRSISDRTTVNVFAGLEYFMTTSDEVAGVDSGEISNLRAELGAGITRRYASSVLYAEARLLGDIMRDDPTPTINGWSEEGANPGTVGAGFRVGAAYDINEFWSIGANAGVEIMGDATSAGANVGASLKF